MDSHFGRYGDRVTQKQWSRRHPHNRRLLLQEIIPIACSTELTSEGWAKILRDEVYAKHGMPQVVISD